MGREPWSDRLMVEECDELSTFDPKIKKIIWDSKVAPIINVSFCDDTGRPTCPNQWVHMVKTMTQFGGYRHWFLCPYCRKKYAKLWNRPGDTKFACRKCYNLTYRSQKEHNGSTHRWFKQFTGGNSRRAWGLYEMMFGR